MKTVTYITAVMILAACLRSSGLAQGVTQLDTVYTPSGYMYGTFVASIFIPDRSFSKGIGVVLAHYLGGTRLTSRIWCDTLAARGYLAMTIDYPDNAAPPYGLYPNPVRTFKIAVEFLRRNATRFGITTNKVVGFGQSLGSFVWGETVIWDNDDSYFGTDSTIDDHLNAAVLLYGAYDNFNYLLGWHHNLLTSYFSPDPSLRATKGQCITNAANITTPILLIHGTADATLNIAHSRMLHDSLIFHARQCELVEFSADHIFDIIPGGPFTAAGLVAKDAVLSFLARTVTSVPSSQNIAPTQFVLQQNYPNPFNPTTSIRFKVPSSKVVTLKVFDVLGREVATLVNEVKQPGTYTTQFDGNGLSSGMYFYRLQAGSFVDTKKCVLLR